MITEKYTVEVIYDESRINKKTPIKITSSVDGRIRSIDITEVETEEFESADIAIALEQSVKKINRKFLDKEETNMREEECYEFGDEYAPNMHDQSAIDRQEIDDEISESISQLEESELTQAVELAKYILMLQQIKKGL